MKSIEQLAIQTIRMLSVDQINQANSGHPGLPLGAAPMAYTLWTRFLRQNPKNPAWSNRDRFILSAGHGSALLYSLLHLSGYDLSLADLKQFRQLDAKTPGHPEVHHTPGVEATTGPLGQGFANGVGMAMAEAHLAARFNRDGEVLVDHDTYVLCGDGDLMEGVSAEAASLAGHLKLGKLIVLYDSNAICLDGKTEQVFTESVAERFRAYGWQVLDVADGNDTEAIAEAIREARADKEHPTLIEAHTIIGYGSPKAGTNSVHGAPLGEEATEALKQTLGWDYPAFTVPEEVKAHFAEVVGKRGEQEERAWQERFDRLSAKNPEQAKAYADAFAGKLPENWTDALPSWKEGDKAEATRSTSHTVLQAIAKELPNFWGGSADLSGSNKTQIAGEGAFRVEDDAYRNIWYGVREFAMAAINNGIALHGGTKVFGATFFVFSDYLRGAARVAALSKLPVIYVLTHDSVAVGEDGPTHEPIEQLASWRAMPNLDVLRPADANETAQAWRLAVESTDHPTMLVLTRQNIPVLPTTDEKAEEGVARGGYVLSPSKKEIPDGILMGTGSEVQLLIEAQKMLGEDGIDVSVVSLPSTARFDRQDAAYREKVLPSAVRNRLSLEAATTFGWERYVGLDGVALGIDRFGLSAPAEEVLRELGITTQAVVKAYRDTFTR
ncbi:transketolase [uncultured Murdochiella sp.]|uniref:transketolase n=1 Tax=uncultured Murdochiella sp. TaxID=1586095 RepID=UPI002804EC10|nr:transketolase [uncultured Murdochiella sp.]